MLNNNNHNSHCNFAEQIVSFVYGEISETEKTSFEAHLQNCSVCADEVSDFGFIRSSVQEWSAEDFAKLSFPAIEINSTPNKSTFINSWVESIRGYFSLSPVGMSVSFAAVLVFVGLIWFFAAFSNNHNEIASNRDETTKNVGSPSINETSENEMGSKTEISPRKESEELLKPSIQARKNNVKEINAPNRNVRANVKTQQAIKVKNSIVLDNSKINNKTTARTPKKNNIPSLNYEDYEDKSLRLSDILEEVSMR